MPPAPSAGQTLGNAGSSPLLPPLPRLLGQCRDSAVVPLTGSPGSVLCLFLLGPQGRTHEGAGAGVRPAPLCFGAPPWGRVSRGLDSGVTPPSYRLHPARPPHHPTLCLPPTQHSSSDAGPWVFQELHASRTGLGRHVRVWRAGGRCPLVFSAGRACVLRAWEMATSSPALGPVACPRGRCYFCQRGEVIIAQPLPAGRALPPGRGAWGGDTGRPQIGPTGRQAAAPDQGSRRPGSRGPVHLSSPAPASPGRRRGTASETRPGLCGAVPTGGRHSAQLAPPLTDPGGSQVRATQGHGDAHPASGHEAAGAERFPRTDAGGDPAAGGRAAVG